MSSGTTPPDAPDKPKPGPLFDTGYVNAMSHFYRGELGRIMAWRARLDTTTTWAITSTTTIFTVAFSIREMPHIIFFFNICIVCIMLWIESRRYRFYDAFRARVRMLEAHFLVPMVMQNTQLLQGDWQKLVCEDLLLPSFKITKPQALGQRLKRNYIFIFMVILAAWITKIFLHAKVPIDSAEDFYHSLAVSGFPSWVVASIFGFTFFGVIGLTIYVARNVPGEVSDFGNRRNAWRI